MKRHQTYLLILILISASFSFYLFFFKNNNVSKNFSRTDQIKEKLKKNNLNENEKLQLYVDYYIATEKNDERDWAQSELIKLAENIDSQLADQATLKLIQISGKSAKTQEYLVKKIKKTENDLIIAHSVRVFSFNKNPWLLENINKLIAHKSILVRKASIQSMHRICPEQRWSILEKVRKSEKEQSVIEILVREVIRLSGPEAISFLTKMKNMILHDKAKVLIQEGLVNLETHLKPGPCN
ncbi:MAG: hypothetical protein KDD58_11655 [Bdellovibrionales bacterium]|nr:hypothetical protein [Bdellovibrionales bacterium]